MIHYNYVSGTLSSPQGRKANGSSNGIDYARYDVSLSYDPNDTGTYIVQSLSSVYCTGAQAWIVWNAFTEAQVSDAFPINFTQNGSESDSDGELYFLYQWQSSSGNPADIASCQVGEFVTYQATRRAKTSGIGGNHPPGSLLRPITPPRIRWRVITAVAARATSMALRLARLTTRSTRASSLLLPLVIRSRRNKSGGMRAPM